MNARALLVLALACVTAVATARAQTTDEAVGPGDILDVRVHAGGDEQEAYSVTVSPAGRIVCPLIGELQAGGSSAPAIADRIARALGDGFYVAPRVLVEVRERAGRLRIVGEVLRPGMYPVSSAPTLLAACDLAGGLTDFAAARRVRLSRMQAGKPQILTVDLVRVRQGKAPDVTLRNWDRIEVPRRWF